jgi:AcrR family transcriptional regulator
MEKKGVGRPRDGNPEETRKEILRAAGEAFAASGFVGATTRAVAARAGVNVATLHYHYGSKEGLYRAVLRDASRGPLPDIPAGTGEETLGRLVEALFDYGAERPTLSRLALLDALAGPVAPDGASPDLRVGWLAEGLRPLLSSANGRPAPTAEEPARAIVALVDATFVTAVPRPRAGTDAGLPGTGIEAPEPLPDAVARLAVVAAARRLIGLR